MCTILISLKVGWFTGDFETDSFAANGFYTYDDFYQLGLRAGLPEAIVKREIAVPEIHGVYAFTCYRAALQDTELDGFTDQGGGILYAEFFYDTLAVSVYSWNADEKFLGNFCVSKAFGNELQYFFFASGNDRLLRLWFI